MGSLLSKITKMKPTVPSTTDLHDDIFFLKGKFAAMQVEIDKINAQLGSLKGCECVLKHEVKTHDVSLQTSLA